MFYRKFLEQNYAVNVHHHNVFSYFFHTDLSSRLSPLKRVGIKQRLYFLYINATLYNSPYIIYYYLWLNILCINFSLLKYFIY